MFMCMDASNSYAAGAYFVLLVLVGAFWSINLFLAVLEEAFDDDEEVNSVAVGQVGQCVCAHTCTCPGMYFSSSDKQVQTHIIICYTQEEDQPEEAGAGTGAKVLPEDDERVEQEDKYAWITDDNGLVSNVVMVLILVNTVVLSLEVTHRPSCCTKDMQRMDMASIPKFLSPPPHSTMA